MTVDQPGEGVSEPDDPVGLSEREREIVELIALGHTNSDIAAQMYLSINTVKTYTRSAYRKMGVDSRTRALLWVYEQGLLEVPRANPTPESETS